MAIEYRKLIETDLDIFMEMRMLQLQEEEDNSLYHKSIAYDKI